MKVFVDIPDQDGRIKQSMNTMWNAFANQESTINKAPDIWELFKQNYSKLTDWRVKYRNGKALFMDRIECPICRIYFYVWEKADTIVCECGTNLKRKHEENK